MRYAVIIAGGAGQRLWPFSRKVRPKQLLPLIQGKNLLQLAVERLCGVFDMDKILIVTNSEYVDLIAESIPQLDRENIIGEPMGRDTANAVCLGACKIAQMDPDATMAVFPADQIIRPEELFAESVDLACQMAEKHTKALVTFGLKPTWPHTGLGYIQRAAEIQENVYAVGAFKEKPSHPKARMYVESGNYYWNSGIFIWKVSAIMDQLNQHLSDSVQKLNSALAADNCSKCLDECYPTLEKISIDFAVMEKAPEVIVVELACEWLDVGSWPALRDVNELDEGGNVLVANETALVDSQRNIIVSDDDDHLVALLGLDDCIVVHTKDATLVCHANESQRIKELVQKISDKYSDKHL